MVGSRIFSAQYIPKVPLKVRTPHMRHSQRVWANSNRLTCTSSSSNHLLISHCEASQRARWKIAPTSAQRTCPAPQIYRLPTPRSRKPFVCKPTKHSDNQRQQKHRKQNRTPTNPAARAGKDEPCAHVGSPLTTMAARGQPPPCRFTHRNVTFIRSDTKPGLVQ